MTRELDPKKEEETRSSRFPPLFHSSCSLARSRDNLLWPFKSARALSLFFSAHASTRGPSSLREPAERVEERKKGGDRGAKKGGGHPLPPLSRSFVARRRFPLFFLPLAPETRPAPLSSNTLSPCLPLLLTTTMRRLVGFGLGRGERGVREKAEERWRRNDVRQADA